MANYSCLAPAIVRSCSSAITRMRTTGNMDGMGSQYENIDEGDEPVLNIKKSYSMPVQDRTGSVVDPLLLRPPLPCRQRGHQLPVNQLPLVRQQAGWLNASPLVRCTNADENKDATPVCSALCDLNASMGPVDKLTTTLLKAMLSCDNTVPPVDQPDTDDDLDDIYATDEEDEDEVVLFDANAVPKLGEKQDKQE